MPKIVDVFWGFEFGLEVDTTFSNEEYVSNSYGRNGGQIKCTSGPSGSAGFVTGADGPSGAPTAYPQLVLRVYFCIEAYPLSQNMMIANFSNSGSTPSNNFAIRVNSDGYIQAGYVGSTAFRTTAFSEYEQTSKKICARAWYRLDAMIDVSADPWTLDWQINGEAQNQVSHSASGTTWRAFWIALQGTSDSATNPATTIYIDDVACSSDDTQYPIGPGTSQIVKINGVGTHNNPSAFQNDDASSIDANSWQRISDGAPPTETDVDKADANDGHAVEMFGPFDTSNYLEFTLEDLTLASGEDISCVTARTMIYQGDPNPTPYAATELFYSGGSLGVNGQTGDSFTGDNVIAHPWNPSNGLDLLRQIPVPAGGWDETKFNSLYMRFRSRTNAGSDTSADYYGLSWFGIEVHLTSNEESMHLGCRQGRLPLLGVG